MMVESGTRYDTNPFVGELNITTSDRRIRLNILGKNEDILLNESTGEISGTHICTYRKVDNEKFVKLFAGNVGLIWNLKSTGIKTFTVLMWIVQETAINLDRIMFDNIALERFKESGTTSLTLSSATFARGIKELIGAQILAKTKRRGEYYINPQFCFNGSRIAFTTVLDREQSQSSNTLSDGNGLIKDPIVAYNSSNQ